jgi:beta-lactam-binding protein with PASTA domain
MKLTRLLCACAALVIAVALTACGTATKTTTVVKEAPAQTDTSQSSDAPASDASTDASRDDGSLVSDEGTGGSSGSGKITVPNEVGKNHQAAQDDLQAHGLYNLSEEDATGQGRMLILDRNWKVVSQSPSPGTKVSEDATITLRSKKYTDG